MSQQQIRFSIVTVCLNAEDTILETVFSVQRQTYLNYEYVIWDGVSQDRTVSIIRENAKIKNLIIFSEKDSGLYNAMNRAIEKCSGDYVLFLNSGDTFVDEKVLADMAERIVKDRVRADIYFGNVLRKEKVELFWKVIVEKKQLCGFCWLDVCLVISLCLQVWQL